MKIQRKCNNQLEVTSYTWVLQEQSPITEPRSCLIYEPNVEEQKRKVIQNPKKEKAFKIDPNRSFKNPAQLYSTPANPR